MKRREALAAIGCTALIGPTLFSCKEGSTSMKKEVKTDKAPKALGPYSQAIVANGIVFASGQIALDPATGNIPQSGIEEQTRQVLTNLKAVLEAAGSSLDKAVKCTVFLQDMEDYAAMNAVYAEFFTSPFPARAAVQVARLPRDARVEIEVTAII